MKIKKENGNLWTRDFTIITVGTVVSMLGNALSGFAIGLLVLDMTGSTFLFALYMVMYGLPRVIVPSIAGPFVDKFSRRKIIYTLDFLSAAIYCFFGILVLTNRFNYGFLIMGCLMIGSIDSIYRVAYDSFYPMLVTEGNYTKAYSIQSTLDSLAMIMVPVSAFLYNLIGIGPLFLMNTVSFLAAAIMETRIHAVESYVKKKEETFGFRQYKKDFKEGLDYLKVEKGLLAIALYFAVNALSNGAFNALVLPYFKKIYEHGEYIYIIVMSGMVVGRIIGGVIHYRKKMPVRMKFRIAIVVYLTIACIDASLLYAAIPVMFLLCTIEGIFGTTSYNIRITATQGYVPDEKKGRFNGTFNMLTTVGEMTGQLSAGLIAEFISAPLSEREIVAGFMVLNCAAVLLIMVRNKEKVKPIFNRNY